MEEIYKGYRLVQLESGHWLAVTPDDKESPIHWSKRWVKSWVMAHKKGLATFV